MKKVFKKINLSSSYSKDILIGLLLISITVFTYQFLISAPKTTLFGDAVRFNGYFAMIIKYSLLNYGQFGLWDQFISSGVSWISHPSGLHFSPVAWLAILFFNDPVFAARFMELTYISIASISFYALLRVLKLSRVTCFLISIPYIANQYAFLYGVNGWFEEFIGIMLLPLTVLFVYLGLTKRSYLYMLLGALAMSLHFFDNTYYVFHYNSIVIIWIEIIFGARLLWENKKSKIQVIIKRIFSYIVLNLTFWAGLIGISAVKLIPLLEFRALSARNFISLYEAEKEITSFKTLWDRLLNFFIPPGHTTSFGQWTNDLGIFLILVAFIYFIAKRSLLHGIFLSLLVIGVWGVLANNVPLDLYAFFYNYLPGFSSNKYPFRFIIIIQFAFMVCVALGLDVLIKQKKLLLLRLLGLFFGAIIIFSTISFMLKSFSNTSYAYIPDLHELINKSNNLVVKKNSNYKYPPVLSGGIPDNLLVVMSKIIKEYKPEGRMHSTFSSSASPFVTTNAQLLLGEIPSTQHSYAAVMPTYEYGALFPEGTMGDIKLTEKIFKIFTILNVRFQFQQKENFEFKGCPKLSLPQKKDIEEGKKLADDVCSYLESRLTPVLTTEAGGIYYDSKVLRKVDVLPQSILLISDNRFNDYSGFIAKKIMLHQDFDEHKITIFSGGSTYLDDYPIDILKQFKVIILVNPKVRNTDRTVSLIREYERGGGKIIKPNSQWTEYESLHQRSSSLWNEKPAWDYSDEDSRILSDIFKSFKTNEEKNSIKIEKFTPEDVILSVESTKDNQALQFSDSYYPGWKAEIDGERVPVYMADGLVKGVIVPKGEHIVRFYYAPDSLKYGAMISGFTAFLILGGISFQTFKKRRQNKAKK